MSEQTLIDILTLRCNSGSLNPTEQQLFETLIAKLVELQQLKKRRGKDVEKI